MAQWSSSQTLLFHKTEERALLPTASASKGGREKQYRVPSETSFLVGWPVAGDRITNQYRVASMIHNEDLWEWLSYSLDLMSSARHCGLACEGYKRMYATVTVDDGPACVIDVITSRTCFPSSVFPPLFFLLLFLSLSLSLGSFLLSLWSGWVMQIFLWKVSNLLFWLLLTLKVSAGFSNN